MDDTSVKVAVRVRPQLGREKIDMCQICTAVVPGEPQVVLGKDKAFTFDYVFDLDSTQEHIYQQCCRELIEGTFEGYNATIFAYGQTGSGKTFTMGTGFDVSLAADLVGIIPRAVEHLFSGIDTRRRTAQQNGAPLPDFKVNAQFMELYNEEILDLLDTTRDPSEKGRKSHIRIHEDASGGIYTVGVATRPVNSLQDTMQCLKLGALSRTTASTNMNAQSSRSHAIFTLHIRQRRLARPDPTEDEEDKDRDSTEALTESEMLSAKFHFVDLAGSERLKRTGATGDRAKEGISINCGLLALGNVISALGDKQKKGTHVPYRDSKLTRLLQDSLGGNSRTMMIACISPSDRDFMETLNTLKYANRARNIHNKVMVNQDKTSRQISALRAEIQALHARLSEYRAGGRVVDGDDADLQTENVMLQSELAALRHRLKALQESVESATLRNVQLLADKDALSIAGLSPVLDGVAEEARRYIESYIKEMEELRSRLVESEALVEALKRAAMRHTPSRMLSSPMITGAVPFDLGVGLGAHGGAGGHAGGQGGDQSEDVLGAARRELNRLKKKSHGISTSKSGVTASSSCKALASDEEKHDGEDNDLDDPEDEEHEVNGERGEEEDGEEEEEANSDQDTDNDEDEEELSNGGTGELRENLAELTCEISLKQKLIAELELSQRRLHLTKAQYEDKLSALETKIRETQEERDRVLASLSDVERQSSVETQRVREEYERRLAVMAAEVRRVEAASKDHAHLLRNQSHYEKQVKAIQLDLSEMKKLKVQLLNKLKEEAGRSRAVDAQRTKEISQLRKDQRLRDNQIKSLEADRRQKDVILKRKQEEVESLRKRQHPVMSAKVAGRTGRYEKEPTVPVSGVGERRKKQSGGVVTKFNPKTSKAVWDNLEKSVSAMVTKKHTIGHIERDMERWLKEREHLSSRLERCIRKKDRVAGDNSGEDLVKGLSLQIESLRANIMYVQDNINDCQSNIMQMEEAKEDEVDPLSLFGRCSVGELKYLLEHAITLCISKGLVAAQREAESKELDARLHQERMDSTFQRDMLHYLIQDKVDIDIDDSLIAHRDDSESESETSSEDVLSPVDSAGLTANGLGPTLVVKQLFDEMLKPPHTTASNSSASPVLHPLGGTLMNGGAAAGGAEGTGMGLGASGGRRDKARRKHATPEELLFAGGAGPPPDLPPCHPAAESGGDAARLSRPPDANLMPPPRLVPKHRQANGASGPQATRPDSMPPLRVDVGPSPLPGRKVLPSVAPLGRQPPGQPPPGRAPPGPPDPSPLLRRKVLSSSVSSSGSGSLSRLSVVSDTNTADTSPPTSPTLTRRGGAGASQGNVFSRLTSRTQPTSPHPTRGVIQAAPNKSHPHCPLIHCYTAVGHSKAVLSVYATDSWLFTASKDRTAKVWDLGTGEEVLTLDSHQNNVVSIKFAEETGLICTVSTYLIRLWDPRQGPTCIKTLSSSGLTIDGTSVCGGGARQATCPSGESNVADIALNSQGTVVYSAAGNTVRIWDLRTYKSVGKLSGGHQAAVMALAIDDTDTADGSICVVTGSKDHYIKVFEVAEDSVGLLTPKYNLEPPHYDGVQSLCLMGDLLFSGSRDNCIKKWDLSNQELKQSLNQAHKDWVCGLAFMPSTNCLLSGCRGGVLKVWHIDHCALVGELQAHNSPINSICANSSLLFSASNDRTVHFWRSKGSCDNMSSL